MPDADGRRRRDHGPGLDWAAVRDELSATAPDGFVDARERKAAAARKAGQADLARRIHGLHRPTLSAWASNLLVRSTRKEVESFLRLGESMRQAQQDLDGPQLRELSRQQWRVISMLSKQAATLASEAGHPLSDTVRREVESTLRAALADAGAAEQWAAGHLDKPLQAPMQLPSDGSPGRRRPPRERPTAADTREQRKRQPAARTAHAAARAELERARGRVDELREALAVAERHLAEAAATERATARALPP